MSKVNEIQKVGYKIEVTTSHFKLVHNLPESDDVELVIKELQKTVDTLKDKYYNGLSLEEFI